MKLFCSKLKRENIYWENYGLYNGELNYGKNILYIRYEVLKKVFNNRRSCLR